MQTTVVGNYPKIPSAKNGVNLRHAINDEETGKITPEELEEVYRRTIVRTVGEQVEAGVDVVTDGQIRWIDLTWPMTASLLSVHPGGLRRFYDNNVYYRRPQVTGLMSRHREIVAEEYRFAASQSSRPVKAVLCGPITFCDLADNYYYKSFGRLAESIAEILAEEAASLVSAGCRCIQLDEPSLPLMPDKMGLAVDLYRRIFAGVEVEHGICIYFNSVRPIAEKLPDLAVTFIALDLISHPDDIDRLSDLNPATTLVAGLFDGRNIMLENEKNIRGKIDQLTAHRPIDRIILSPSCGLEFLPQKYALAKMKRMCEVAAKINGAGK